MGAARTDAQGPRELGGYELLERTSVQDGVVSFRGLTNASVANVANLTYQGANAFRLNASSNAEGAVFNDRAFRGGMPLGGLAAGWFASRTSAPTVMTVNGALLACVAAWFLFRGRGVREL